MAAKNTDEIFTAPGPIKAVDVDVSEDAPTALPADDLQDTLEALKLALSQRIIIGSKDW